MKLSGMEDADRAVMWAEKAHGAAVRLHDVRGERSNVPREARDFTEWGIWNIIALFEPINKVFATC